MIRGLGDAREDETTTKGSGRRRLYSTTVELPLAVIEAALLYLWSWEHAPSAAQAAGWGVLVDRGMELQQAMLTTAVLRDNLSDC